MRKEKITEDILKQLSKQISSSIMSNPNIMSIDPVEGLNSINSLQKNIESNEEIEEKWSEKYKKSIDCKNPKGFSQRAHCQGRKKNESAILKGLK